MGDGYMGENSGNLEILTMNTGYSFNNDSESTSTTIKA